jgi:hypothetical protein
MHTAAAEYRLLQVCSGIGPQSRFSACVVTVQKASQGRQCSHVSAPVTCPVALTMCVRRRPMADNMLSLHSRMTTT